MTDKEGVTNPEEKPYDVGYGRPPKQHQFKPGNSGNRTGRKKGSRNIKTLLAEELKARIDMKVNGKVQRLNKAEAMVKVTIQKALSGEDRSIDRTYRLLREYGLLEEAEKAEPEKNVHFSLETLTREERATLRELLMKSAKSGQPLSLED